MAEYRFWQIDSFSRHAYLGNPAAVVFDADLLSPDDMQTIARQFNLSETVFLCTPTSVDADYRARIFTPASEIPFAGHPTIAAAFAVHSTMLEEDQKTTTILRQECGVGIVPIAVESEGGATIYTLTAGESSAINANVDHKLAAQMLGCDSDSLADTPIDVCSGGLPWLIVRINSLAALKSARPDQSLIEEVCRDRNAIGITVYCEGADLADCDYHLRTFAPGAGIREDPVCGSGGVAVAIHLATHVRRKEKVISFHAEQGLEVFRRGILHLQSQRMNNDQITVRLGGNAARTMTGTLER